MNNDQIFGAALILFATLVLPAAFLFIVPAAKAWTRRLEEKARSEDRSLTDIDDLKTRVAELEERLDFAGRLLARNNEVGRIEGDR
jgi:hypothetical protein